MSSMPLKLLGERLVYGLKVHLGCQRILDLKVAQIIKGGKSKKKRGTL